MLRVLIYYKSKYGNTLSPEHYCRLRYRIDCDFLSVKFGNQELQMMSIDAVNHDEGNLLPTFTEIPVSLIIATFFACSCGLMIASSALASALSGVEALRLLMGLEALGVADFPPTFVTRAQMFAVTRSRGGSLLAGLHGDMISSRVRLRSHCGLRCF